MTRQNDKFLLKYFMSKSIFIRNYLKGLIWDYFLIYLLRTTKEV